MIERFRIYLGKTNIDAFYIQQNFFELLTATLFPFRSRMGQGLYGKKDGAHNMTETAKQTKTLTGAVFHDKIAEMLMD